MQIFFCNFLAAGNVTFYVVNIFLTNAVDRFTAKPCGERPVLKRPRNDVKKEEETTPRVKKKPMWKGKIQLFPHTANRVCAASSASSAAAFFRAPATAGSGIASVEDTAHVHVLLLVLFSLCQSRRNCAKSCRSRKPAKWKDLRVGGEHVLCFFWCLFFRAKICLFKKILRSSTGHLRHAHQQVLLQGEVKRRSLRASETPHFCVGVGLLKQRLRRC